MASELNIALSLLDPVKGHPIQTWEFKDRAVIRIGRSDTNDVVIGDPLVSRLHVEITAREDGRWRLTSVGRNGTWVDSEPVSDAMLLRSGMVLQLGSNGPWVEFREGRQERGSGETLVGMSLSSLPLPQVDTEMMQAEVSRIADGDLFKGLQKQAQEFKKALEDKGSQ